MTERIYVRDFDHDPSTKAQNTSVRYTKEGIYMSFSHSAQRYAGFEGDDKKARTFFLVRSDGELYPGLQVIHEREPEVLAKVIEDLQEIKSEQDLNFRQEKLLDTVISGINSIVNPEDAKEKPKFWTRRPNPRTSSEAVDVFWFKQIRDKN